MLKDASLDAVLITVLYEYLQDNKNSFKQNTCFYWKRLVYHQKKQRY